MSEAGVYLRISHDPDDAALGVARQAKECRELLTRRGWTAAETFTENDRSAFKKRSRPVFAEMLTAIREGRVRTVVAWALDRLYRHPQDGYDLMEAVQQGGGLIATVKDGELDPGTATGEMMMTQLSALARFESKRKSERLVSMHRDLSESGAWQGGPRPFGYDVVGGKKTTGQPARLVINKREAAAIRAAATAILNGSSLYRVTADWNDAGITTPKGKRWAPSHVRRTLLSPTISAIRIVGKDTVPGAWTAILSPETRSLLVAKLTDGARKPKGGFGHGVRARRYPLSGIARCARDGTPMVGESGNNGHWSYRCSDARGGCGSVRISGAPLEALVLDAIAGRRWPTSAFRRSTSVAATDAEAELLAEQANVGARIDQLATDYADGALTASQVKVATAKLESNLADVNERLAAIIEKRAGAPMELAANLVDYHTRAASGELEPHEVAELAEFVGSWVDAVTVAPAGKRGVRFNPARVQLVWRKEAA